MSPKKDSFQLKFSQITKTAKPLPPISEVKICVPQNRPTLTTYQVMQAFLPDKEWAFSCSYFDDKIFPISFLLLYLFIFH